MGRIWAAGSRLSDKPQTAEQAVRAAGMDWTVRKIPKRIDPSSNAQENHWLVREDLWDSTREDRNGTDVCDGLLGEVGADYVVLQNTDVFAFFDPVVAAGGMYYESAGSSTAGKTIWLAARLPGDLEIAPGDKIGCFISLTYSHGLYGRKHNLDAQLTTPTISFYPVRLLTDTPLEGYFSHRRVLSIENPSNRIIRLTRTADGRPSLERGTEPVLHDIHEQYEKLAGFFRDMAGVRVNGQEFVEAAFPEPVDPGDDEKYNKLKAERRERIIKCAKFLEDGGHPESKGTLWGAYNAVIEYNVSCRAAKMPGRVHPVILYMAALSMCYPSGK